MCSLQGRIVKSKVDKYKNQRVEIRQVPKNPGSVEDYVSTIMVGLPHFVCEKRQDDDDLC